MASEAATIQVEDGGIYPRGFSSRTDWEWPLVRSSEVVQLNYGKALKATERVAGGIPVYGTNGQCGWHNESLTEGPGVILGRKGQGPLGVEWCDKDFWVIDTAYFATPKVEDIDLRYFYYLVKYIGLNHLKDGTSNPSLSRDTFADLLLPIPPKETQRAIVSIVRALDDKIELNRRMNATLESLARAIFKSWFVDFDPVRGAGSAGRPHEESQNQKSPSGRKSEQPSPAAPATSPPPRDPSPSSSPASSPFTLPPSLTALFPSTFQDSDLGPIPEGWEVKTIDEVTSLIIDYRGKTPKKLGSDWSDSGIPAVSAKNVKDGRLVRPETMKFVDEELFVQWMKDTLELRDILMTSEAPLGELYYLATNANFCLSQRVYGIRANPDVCEPSFLYFWLESADCQYEMESRATGTTVVGIRQAELRKVNVLVPPIEIQRAAAEFMDDALLRLHANEQQSATLSALRDTLLPKLLSGELPVPAALTATSEVLA